VTAPSLSSTTSRRRARSSAFLDEFVIGQVEAKKILAVAVYNHYKRIQTGPLHDDDVEVAKSNVLLLGPTGCGKDVPRPDVGRMLNVPFAIADATGADRGRYVGEDVENILLKLLSAGGLRREARRARESFTSTRSTRSRARLRTLRSRVTYPGKVFSRRC